MRWPPYKHVFFDCDSTLTAVEGIDILATSPEMQQQIGLLTQAAMDGDLDLAEVYGKRLATLNPTHKQIHDIRQAYKRHAVPHAKRLISALKALGHEVYIISGGLLEPVREFGIYLGVPKSHIRAVDVAYNQLSGAWWQGDDAEYMSFEKGKLTVSDGKAEIVEELLGKRNGGGNNRSLLIGDGSSDLFACRSIDLFVGYGGVVARKQVMEEAPVTLSSKSLAPLLAIAAGPAGIKQLLKQSEHQKLAKKTLTLIQANAICFNNPRLKDKFQQSMQANFPNE